MLLQVTALNLNYSDNGLFGIYTVCDGSAAGKVVLVICDHSVVLHFIHVATQVGNEGV